MDSDEERDSVMAAIARAFPRPLTENHVFALQAKAKNVRIKECIRDASGGTRGGNLFAVAPRGPSGPSQAARQALANREVNVSRPAGVDMDIERRLSAQQMMQQHARAVSMEQAVAS